MTKPKAKQKAKPKDKAKKRKPATKQQAAPEQLQTINVRLNPGHKYKPGNRFWELRSSHGRKPIFATPEHLWNAATEYFEWCEQNPLYEMKPFAYRGKVIQEAVAKMRIMTIESMCLFLDISTVAWYEYKKRPDFVNTCDSIDHVVRQQGIAGASADLLNPMIVARVHGLKESIAAEHTGKDGKPIETVTRIELVPLSK